MSLPIYIYATRTASCLSCPGRHQTTTDYTTNATRPYLRFKEIRNTPFLDGDSAEYFCRIVRFTIQTRNTLPAFVPNIVTGQNDPNLTIDTVTLIYQATPVTRHVIYAPEDRTAPLPAPPLIQQDISIKYYYVYNYSNFMDMVSATLQTAFIALRTTVQPAAIDDPKPTLPPYLDITRRALVRVQQIGY
ncbi:MAG: phage minor capsid protein, partial [Candidatus Fonsibacter sp.]